MRIRVGYAKNDALRYTGHLDLQHIWERALRRSRLPVAYSQGFNPQARINLASALPLGFTSRCELMDFWLEDDLPLEMIAARLRAAAHPGTDIQSAWQVELREPALQVQVRASSYRATLSEPASVGELAGRIEALLAAETLPRQRKGKPYDLRPLVEAVSVAEDGALLMRLSAREGATGRPEEVLSALGIDPLAARVERVELILGG